MEDQRHQWEQELVAVGEEHDLRWRRSKSGEGSFKGTVLQTEKAGILMEM